MLKAGAILAWASLALMPACFHSSATGPSPLQNVDELMRHGETEAARQRLIELTDSGVPGERAEAGLILCAMAEESARDCYLNLANSLESEIANPVVADTYALALYRFYRQETLKQRLLGFMKLSLQCPATPAGLKAVNYLKGHWHSLAPVERLAAWRAWGSVVHDIKIVRCPDDPQSAQVSAIIALERASAHLEIQQAKEAAEVLETVWPVVAQSVWWDDVLIVRAESLKQLERYNETLDVLQVFLERREDSYFVGSYESAFFDDAMMMRAEIFQALGKNEEAREAYLSLVEDAPTSLLRDDAAYRAALLQKKSLRRQALLNFLKDYPESRWAGAAQRATTP